MSKIDKNIQEAREWQKKHGAEGHDVSALDQSLVAWETQVRLLEEALAKAFAARKATIEARKAVGKALRVAKAARKSKPQAAAVSVPGEKKAPTKKVVVKATT